jgi:hypothetical protein
MSEYDELMSRQAKLMETFQARHVPGTHSTGPILRKNGDLILPIYNAELVRIEDLMMAKGETQVTRCWGRGPEERELLEG